MIPGTSTELELVVDRILSDRIAYGWSPDLELTYVIPLDTVQGGATLVPGQRVRVHVVAAVVQLTDVL